MGKVRLMAAYLLLISMSLELGFLIRQGRTTRFNSNGHLGWLRLRHLYLRGQFK
jgi:hypothetical protein